MVVSHSHQTVLSLFHIRLIWSYIFVERAATRAFPCILGGIVNLTSPGQNEAS